MKPTEPLPLHHSWPLSDRDLRFDLGHLSDGTLPGVAGLPVDPALLARHGIGVWQCDLRDDGLSWSTEVHALFGLPRDARPTRDETVAFYREGSRAAMERLRRYAIRHLRGFTLDVEIVPAQGAKRWMRLTAAPICEGDRAIRLHGLKEDVTHLYPERRLRRASR